MRITMDYAVENGSLKYFNIIYDIAFIVLTMVSSWFLPIKPVNIIETDILLFCIILAVLFFFHHEDARALGFTGWVFIFLGGLLWLAFSILLEPMWWTFGITILEHGYREANRDFGSKLPANIFILIGFSACYMGIIGFTRQVLLRLFERRWNKK